MTLCVSHQICEQQRKASYTVTCTLIFTVFQGLVWHFSFCSCPPHFSASTALSGHGDPHLAAVVLAAVLRHRGGQSGGHTRESSRRSSNHSTAGDCSPFLMLRTRDPSPCKPAAAVSVKWAALPHDLPLSSFGMGVRDAAADHYCSWVLVPSTETLLWHSQENSRCRNWHKPTQWS